MSARLVDHVYRTARFITGDEARADDAVRDVFLAPDVAGDPLFAVCRTVARDEGERRRALLALVLAHGYAVDTTAAALGFDRASASAVLAAGDPPALGAIDVPRRLARSISRERAAAVVVAPGADAAEPAWLPATGRATGRWVLIALVAAGLALAALGARSLLEPDRRPPVANAVVPAFVHAVPPDPAAAERIVIRGGTGAERRAARVSLAALAGDPRVRSLTFVPGRNVVVDADLPPPERATLGRALQRDITIRLVAPVGAADGVGVATDLASQAAARGLAVDSIDVFALRSGLLRVHLVEAWRERLAREAGAAEAPVSGGGVETLVVTHPRGRAQDELDGPTDLRIGRSGPGGAERRVDCGVAAEATRCARLFADLEALTAPATRCGQGHPPVAVIDGELLGIPFRRRYERACDPATFAAWLTLAGLPSG